MRVDRAFVAALRWLWRRWWVRAYLALLVASHLVIAAWDPSPWGEPAPPAGVTVETVSVPALERDGSAAEEWSDRRLRVWRWGPEPREGGPPPVLMLHGSPSGGASDFAALGPRVSSLPDRGPAGGDGAGARTVFALDRPGYSGSDAWWPSYSVRANAHVALAAMDALGVERAHVLGWSQGGGAALWMADIAPGRVASLALVGSIGIQEGEGSGDYHFEHAKYALGMVGLVWLPELVPHFNLIGSRGLRHAFIRDFWDTDQRPLRALMERSATPTIIVHGRDDPLVPAWVAEAHHGLIGPSRLVMLDASHFFVLGGPMGDEGALDAAAAAIASFALRHDEPGGAVRRGSADFAPAQGLGRGLAAAADRLGLGEGWPWWGLVLAIALATLVSEDLTVIAVGLLVAAGRLDVAVGLLGCMIGILGGDYGLWALGRFGGRRVLKLPLLRRSISPGALERWGRLFDAHTGKAVFLSRFLPGTRLPMYVAAGVLARKRWSFLLWMLLAVVLWTPILMGVAALVGPRIYALFEGVLHGPLAVIAAFVVLAFLIRLASYEATKLGRQRLKADAKRLISREFWPAWLFYAPLVPWIAWLGARRGGLMSFTCVNPGIANGGGVVGESKAEIARGFPAGDPRVLPVELIARGGPSAARADRAIALAEGDERFGGWPVVLKPDCAQRGHGMKLARGPADVRAYFEEMTRDAILQRFHPGPNEAGILWARDPGAFDGVSDAAGEITSVTRKVFPVIEGDGRRTLEELVWHHPRYRMQARVFLTRFAGEADRVLAPGERLRLAQAGNHAQGTMFLDGADLITPRLTEAIDALARGFARSGEPGRAGGLDYGRFDLRYTDDESLRRGEGFAVVEVNGSMSEPTNMYDPRRSLWWSYGVLFGHWDRVYRLGRLRRLAGVAPLRARGLWRLMRQHYRGRPGSSVSD